MVRKPFCRSEHADTRPLAGTLVEALESRKLMTTYAVTTVADNVAGSLREAILSANSTAGTDTISFNIGGGGVRTITPASPLPIITDAVTIDATTQPGYYNSPLIALAGPGSDNFSNRDGLVFNNSGSNALIGLSVYNWLVGVRSFTAFTAKGNYFGILPDGATIGRNQVGMVCYGIAKIGTDTSLGLNYFGGNGTGLVFSSGNVVSPGISIVRGNVFGQSPSGAALPNDCAIAAGYYTSFLIGDADVSSQTSNIIANSKIAGIVARTDSPPIIRVNTFINNKLDIDRGPDGITPNDTAESDGVQNKPIFTGPNTVTLRTTPNTTTLIYTYALNNAGTARTLSHFYLTTDSTGYGSVTFGGSINSNERVEGTATTSTLGTSEMSDPYGTTQPLQPSAGTYTVVEGKPISLNGSNTGDQNVSYAWDFNTDGNLDAFKVDAAGKNPVYTAGDGPARVYITLRVTNASGQVAYSTGVIVVNNAAPTATLIGSTTTLGNAGYVKFNNPTDSSTADIAAGFTYAYDFNNDGDFTDAGDIASSTSPIGTYTFSTTGSHSVRARISDKDGGHTDYTANIVVNPATTASSVYIDAGGPAAGVFAADNGFSGGSTSKTTAAINTSGVANPAPQAVYQSERYGNFTYAIGGFAAGKRYDVRLDFAETYWSAAGKRSFNVTGNGAAWLTNFDVFAAAGGKNNAVARTFTAFADNAGKVTIVFKSLIDNAKVSGISITPSAVVPPATFTPILINAGGSASGGYAGDGSFAGGSTYKSAAAVDTSGVANAAPQSVYQTERFGNFTYTLAGLVAGQQYGLSLDFAELYWTAAGQRLFNVGVNNNAWLSNFDIFAAAGGKNKAIRRTLTVTADSSGTVKVAFTSLKDNAKVSGITLTSLGA